MNEYLVAPSIDKPKYIIPLNRGYLLTNSLGLYSPLSPKRKLQMNSLRMLNCLKSLKLIFRHRIVSENKIGGIIHGFDSIHNYICKAFGSSDLYFAFLLSNRCKTIVQVIDKDTNILGYVKAVTGVFSKKNINNEYKVLKFLNQCNLRNFCVPQVTLRGASDDYYFLVLTTYKTPIWRSNLKLTRAHVDALIELFRVNFVKSPFMQSGFYKIIKERLDEDINITREFRNMFDHIVHRIHSYKLSFGLCHYDFKPWNVRELYNNKLYVFDWEIARFNWLPLWDFFHYILQPAILVKGLGPVTLIKMLRQKRRLAAVYLRALDIPQSSYALLLDLYLLDVLTYYRKKTRFLTDKQTYDYAHSIENLLKCVVYEK